MIINANVEVDDDLAQSMFSQALRSKINAKVKSGLATAAERSALPRARALAPSIGAQSLIAKSTTRSAYITTKGPKVYDRILGMHEYGGSVTSDIVPKKKLAIKIGEAGEDSIIRAVAYRGPFVGKPMKVEASNPIKRGVQAALPSMLEIAKDEILEAYE